MANKVTTVFENDTKGAVKSTDALASSIDDVGTKGKLVAQALHDRADQIEADFKDSVAAADALGQALGPELKAKIGQAGIDKFVVDLKAAGLTSDDIRTDVNELAGAIKHLDDVGRQLDGPKQGLRDVGDSATHAKTEIAGMRGESDNSRSVLANMVGNSTQDVAGLGGVAGSAGLALGQMGEYAADGNISLKGLAKVAGPMAAVTLVASQIGTELSKMAAVKAFNKKQVDDWVKAIRDGKDATVDLAAAAAEVGKIEFHGLTDTTDLAPVLHDLGLKAQDFFDAIKGGQPSIDEFTQKAKDAGASSGQLRDIFFASRDYAKNWGDAVGGAAIQAEVFGQSTEDAAKKAAAGTKRYEDQVAKTSDEVQRSIDDMQASWDKLNGSISAMKSMIQYKQQVDDVKQAIADAGAAELEFGVGSPEAITAKENARLKTLDLESTTADLGQTILGLPAEQVTNLIAQIDRGELDNMPGIIQGVLDTHTYRINAHLDNIVIDGETHAAGSTGSIVHVTASHAPGAGRAAGGPVEAGKAYMVGEKGPEPFVPDQNGTIIPNWALGGLPGGEWGPGPQPQGPPAIWSGAPRPVIVQVMMNDRVVQEILISSDRLKGSVS